MFTPLRVTARILTGSTYLLLGLDAARVPGARVDQAAPMLAAIRRFIPLPKDDELIVRTNAAVQVVAGALLTAGLVQQPAAIALVGSLIPTTAAGHAFWTIEDPMSRKMQRIQFQKNMAMIGGLLFAVLDCPLAGSSSTVKKRPARQTLRSAGAARLIPGAARLIHGRVRR